MIEEVGISKKDNLSDVIKYLETIFSGVNFIELDIDSIDSISPENNKVLYQIIITESEFSSRIEFYFPDDGNTEMREKYIARLISNKFSCKTIVPYENPENKSIPYYSLIFDSGKYYLADDLDTKYNGDGNGKVKIIKEIEILTTWVFDEFGSLAKNPNS